MSHRRTSPGAARNALLFVLVSHLVLSGHGAGAAMAAPAETTTAAKPDAVTSATEKGGGLEAGTKVTIRRKSQILEGTLKKVTPDNQPVTVLTDTKGEVKVWLKDVKRIILTGDVVKRGPGKPQLRRGYLNAYRFETVKGLVVEGGPTIVPFFELEGEEGSQNLHLRQISLIETGENVSAPGLTIGSRVRCKTGDKGIFGTIVALNFPNPDAEIIVMTDAGEQKNIPLRNLIRISLVRTETGAPAMAAVKVDPAKIRPAAKTYEVADTEGRIVRGKILQPPLFSIDTGEGIARNIWADMQVIEKQ